MKKIRLISWVAMAIFILIFEGAALAQEHQPDVDIHVISREIDPNVDIDEIGKQIATHPAYERAAKIAKEIEDDLNRRVQEMVEERKDEINAINQQILEQTIGPNPAEKKGEGGLFDEKTRIFIFVSRSVPLEILKSYAAGIDSLGSSNVRLAFRAFPRHFLNSVLIKSPDCETDDCVVKAKIAIGPKPFKRYGIQHVPAVVYDLDPTNPSHANWIKASGAAPLEKILTIFYRETNKEALQLAAQRIVKK